MHSTNTGAPPHDVHGLVWEGRARGRVYQKHNKERACTLIRTCQFSFTFLGDRSIRYFSIFKLTHQQLCLLFELVEWRQGLEILKRHIVTSSENREISIPPHLNTVQSQTRHDTVCTALTSATDLESFPSRSCCIFFSDSSFNRASFKRTSFAFYKMETVGFQR